MATPTKKILLTGFEPFGGMATNPSELVVRSLADCRMDGIELSTMVLPVEYHRAMDIIREQVGQYDAIVMLGVARTRQEISLERVAINLMDASSKDKAGYRPDEEPIVSGAPLAYFSNVAVKRLTTVMKDYGHPCKLSNSAGTYVCNAIYYAALHEVALRSAETRVLFIHLPSERKIPIEKMAESIKMALLHISISND